MKINAYQVAGEYCITITGLTGSQSDHLLALLEAMSKPVPAPKPDGFVSTPALWIDHKTTSVPAPPPLPNQTCTRCGKPLNPRYAVKALNGYLFCYGCAPK